MPKIEESVMRLGAQHEMQKNTDLAMVIWKGLITKGNIVTAAYPFVSSKQVLVRVFLVQKTLILW